MRYILTIRTTTNNGLRCAGLQHLMLSSYLMSLNSNGEKISALVGNIANPIFRDSLHEDNFGILTHIQYKKLRSTLWYGSSDQGAGRRNTAAGNLEEGDNLNQRYFANITYPFNLPDDWSMLLKLTSSGLRDDLELVGDGLRIQYETDEQLVEVDFAKSIGEKSELLSGLVATRYTGDTPGVIQPVPEWNYVGWNVYTQFDYQYSDHLKVTLGGQNNKVEDNTRFVPRVGVVMNFNPHWGMKILYGEAFRTPIIVETDANIPAVNLFGNPDLEPEMITTVDVQTFYHQRNAQLVLTYFYSRQEDLSVRVSDPPIAGSLALATFRNEGSLTIEGLELEGKFTLGENWFVTGGLTYQQNRGANGIDDYTLEPHWEGRLGIGYTSSAYNIGVYDIFRGGYQNAIIRNDTLTTQLNPVADAYHLISVNANLDLGAATNGFLRGTSLSLHIQNLLDEPVFLPSVHVGGYDANTVPSQGGRVLWGKITYDF